MNYTSGVREKHYRARDVILFALMLFYFMCMNIRYIFDLDYRTTTAAWSFLGVMLFSLIAMYKIWKSLKTKWAFMSIAISLPSILINRNNEVVDIVLLLISVGFGISLYYFRKELKTPDRIAVGVLIFLCIRLLTLFYKYPIDSEYRTVSRLLGTNTATIHMLLLVFIDVIHRQYVRKAPNFVLIFLCFLVALLSSGTGNILSFSVLMLGYMIINKNGDRIVWTKAFLLLMAIVAFVVFRAGGVYVAASSIVHEEHGRFWIWNRYFQHIKDNYLKNIVFGANITSDYKLDRGFIHLHNTFLTFHKNYGLMPLICLCVAITKGICGAMKSKNFYIAHIVLVTVIRALTDEAANWFIPIWVFCFFMSDEDWEGIRRGVNNGSDDLSQNVCLRGMKRTYVGDS
ncbi:MAG: hypothetical protein K6F53_07285 [Lachnospiraceae bacterium]|nr:hypothetical protein [Lachnospiraceae bacterium]